MKKLISAVSLTIFLLSAQNSFAQSISDEVKTLQEDWTAAKYKSKNKDQIVSGLDACSKKAESLVKQYPKNPELLIWNGICLASQGEYLKIKALSKVKEAKSLFEQALSINPKSLDGSAYTNLGVLYNRVPGWPIGFGDTKKAEENFKKAIEIAPENIDANFFYGEFLFDEGRYEEAKKYLTIALNAPSRNRPLADQKRHEEIELVLAKIRK